jgi:hypothetical protein
MLEWDEDKGCSCGQKEHPQGDFVYYSVYAEVKAGWQAAASRAISYIGQLGDQSAENARLKAECQARQAENSVLAVECDSLKAEVERLAKAGDNLVYVASEHPVSEPFVKAWFAAKEGKQP